MDMKSVIKRVAHEKNILATDIRPNGLSVLKFRKRQTSTCFARDAVYGKIGGKVIPKYPINMPKKQSGCVFASRGSFFRIKRTYRYGYPVYREKSCEADPQCRDVKFRKLRMRAYFADRGDVWKKTAS